jgi:hypothetical protein
MIKENFYDEVRRKNLYELIGIPFYLVQIKKIFNEKAMLPNSKAELFQNFIELKIQEDINHYKTTKDLSRKKKIILALLSKIAITMESLGRNYILESELEQIINIDEKELLIYTGLFEYDKQENYWRFQHNNFQEYLAAKVLSKNKLDSIKQFIAFDPDHNKIIPSWTNTLSFLSSLYPKDDLLNWLYESQPEMLVKFERDRISAELRYEILVKIFNYYKQRKIWIDRDKYELFDLGKIASDEQTIGFLIDEAEKEQDNIVRANAIMLFGFLDNLTFENSVTIKTLLLKLITEHRAENLVTKSINALNNLSFHDVTTINQIIQSLVGYSNAHVRSCIYSIIQESKTANDFVDILLDGIQYIRTNYKEGKGSTLVDEGYYLAKGLEQIDTEAAVVKMLEYFIKNPNDLSDVSLRKTVSSISQNISKLIKNNNEKVFDLAFEMLMTLGKQYILEYTREFINCFKASDTKLKVFIKTIEDKSDAGIKYNVLSLLATRECIDYVVEKYNSDELLNLDMGVFRNFLTGSQPELKNYLDDKLKRETKFVFPKAIDYESQRINQRKRDLEMFFDKKIFFEEIGLAFEKEQKEVFSEDEIHKIELKNWEIPIYANKALDIIRDYSRNNDASLGKIIDDYEKVDFDYLFVSEVYNRLEHNDDFELEEKHVEKIKKWCYDKVKDVDFKKALNVLPNRQFQTSTYALYTWFFMRKFELNYSEGILLDMLSYSWHGVGVDFLETKIDSRKIVKRILENLESNAENEIAIQNYFAFGLKYKIKDFISYGRLYLGNTIFDVSTRTTILDYLIVLDDADDGIEKALKKTNDEFKWQIVDKLYEKKNKNLKHYLLTLLENGDDNDKLMSSQYLIEMQEIEGLKYFSNKIKIDNEFNFRWFRDRNALKVLVIKEAVPYLLEMLELTYHKEFRQSGYDKLERKIFDAISNISLQSEENYFYVKLNLEKFIKEKEYINDDIRFIHSFLERLERTFYFNKSQNITLEQVIDKLKLLSN